MIDIREIAMRHRRMLLGAVDYDWSAIKREVDASLEDLKALAHWTLLGTPEHNDDDCPLITDDKAEEIARKFLAEGTK